MPSWAAAIAVARAWFDCSPPHVITCVAFCGLRLGEQVLELADLVARQLAAGLIVALDPEPRAASTA